MSFGTKGHKELVYHKIGRNLRVLKDLDYHFIVKIVLSITRTGISDIFKTNKRQ